MTESTPRVPRWAAYLCVACMLAILGTAGAVIIDPSGIWNWSAAAMASSVLYLLVLRFS
jgi:hypothetical protein